MAGNRTTIDGAIIDLDRGQLLGGDLTVSLSALLAGTLYTTHGDSSFSSSLGKTPSQKFHFCLPNTLSLDRDRVFLFCPQTKREGEKEDGNTQRDLSQLERGN